MLKVITESGSIYTIKNGRISGESKSGKVQELVNNLFRYYREPVRVGIPIMAYLPEFDRYLLTTPVVNIEQISEPNSSSIYWDEEGDEDYEEFEQVYEWDWFKQLDRCTDPYCCEQ